MSASGVMRTGCFGVRYVCLKGDSQLTRCPYISLIEIGRFNVQLTLLNGLRMGLDERIGCNENGLFWCKICLFEGRFAVDPMPLYQFD
jgi:hypothetical protein